MCQGIALCHTLRLQTPGHYHKHRLERQLTYRKQNDCAYATTNI